MRDVARAHAAALLLPAPPQPVAPPPLPPPLTTAPPPLPPPLPARFLLAPHGFDFGSVGRALAAGPLGRRSLLFRLRLPKHPL